MRSSLTRSSAHPSLENVRHAAYQGPQFLQLLCLSSMVPAGEQVARIANLTLRFSRARQNERSTNYSLTRLKTVAIRLQSSASFPYLKARDWEKQRRYSSINQRLLNAHNKLLQLSCPKRTRRIFALFEMEAI